jgi:uncharacterized protein
MAEILISPGVLARENDQSFITRQPTQAGTAIIGPAVKGPVGIPTLVTSYSDYVSRFGEAFTSGGTNYSYLTSYTAYNYFTEGGTTLLVTRVVTGSFTAASSSTIATGSGGPTSGLSPFVLETLSEGTIMNSTSTEASTGALASGSTDNIRWEIPFVNTSSGQFSLVIRRGNDILQEKSIIESFNNLSLDPFSDNYITKVIGDTRKTVVGSVADGGFYVQETGSYANKSNYVRVSTVNFNTPRYLDNSGLAKDEYTGSLPVAQSGSFGGAVGNLWIGEAKFNENITAGNIQGINGDNYTESISLLLNQDDFQFNVIVAPGLNYDDHSTEVAQLINLCQERGDAIAVVDMAGYNSSITNYKSLASSLNSSYAATYAPWLRVSDPATGQLIWVPSSTVIPGVYAFNDRVAEPWFAPAGLNRGGLATVIKPERKYTQANRDTLYESKINPIASFPNAGTVVFGQKTLQTKASALDRVNVRRLLIQLKGFISQIADNLVFEQNSAATRNQFLSQANPYLESVQQRQGLYAFKVVMDDSNNTPDVIDRNQLVGAIYLQPTKTAEFIILDFNVLPTGAVFPS